MVLGFASPTEDGDESSGVSRPGTGKKADGGKPPSMSFDGARSDMVRESRKAAVFGVRAFSPSIVRDRVW